MQEIVDQERHSFIIDHRLANGEIRTVEINSLKMSLGQRINIRNSERYYKRTLRKARSILIYALAGWSLYYFQQPS